MGIVFQFLLFVGPPFIISIIVASMYRLTFSGWSRIGLRKDITGAQVARALLEAYGLKGVPVEELTRSNRNYYSGSKRVIRLNSQVYHGKNLAAAGVAAHEVGHAHQHGTRFPLMFAYWFLSPPMSLGNRFGPIIFAVGLVLAYLVKLSFGIYVAWAGAILFGLAFLISLLLLPIEFNASFRARHLLRQTGTIAQPEEEGIKKVLMMAAMTYVAGAVQSLAVFVFFIFVLVSQGRKRQARENQGGSSTQK